MMKKWIAPLILFVIPVCLSILIRSQLQEMFPNILSERNLNFCLQDIICILPGGLMGAGVLIVFPSLFFEWTSFLYKPDWKPTKMDLFQIRAFSGFVFLFSLYFVFVNENMRNTCFNAVMLAK
jgi:hypothetical protein